VRGKLGRDLTVQEGYDAARLSGLSMLASLKHAFGDLDRIAGWARAVGYVNCTPDFAETFLVVNGFSDLILELWGEPGRHARAAPGVAALPLNLPVVVEATVELRR
jgi:enamine deaminase RidA (YjgF/YER057c/UK114 family)